MICSNKKISASSVALINTFLPRNYSFDDIFEPVVVHPGATIVMSALALGEWLKLSIDEFMEAMIVGYEVVFRVADAINPWHYNKGFHPTGTCNFIGVSAMAAKLSNLDIKKTCTSLRLSVDQACGFRQYQIDGNMLIVLFTQQKQQKMVLLLHY